MKKYLILLLSISFLASCSLKDDKDGYEWPYYNVFFTVDNPTVSGNFYLISDGNEKFYSKDVLTTSTGETFKPATGTRLLASFTLLSEKTGDVHNIRLFSCVVVPVEPLTKITEENQDSIKNDPYYVSGAPYMNGNNLMSLIATFSAAKSSEQIFYLVQDTTKTDGKCHLNLRFTNDAKGETTTLMAPLNFDLSALEPNFRDSVRIVLYTNENDLTKTYNMTHKWKK